MTIDQAKIQVEGEITRQGFSIKYRTSLTGCVWETAKRCEIPEIKTRASLYIACHELFHVLFPRAGKKVCVNEVLAERFAHTKMRELGFSVPRKQTTRAKQYVLKKTKRAIKRGMKAIPKEVMSFTR